MLTLNDIIKARASVDDFLFVYDKVFFNGRKNSKVRGWLKRNGIRNSELDDLESAMVVTLAVGIDKYDYDKIPFDKWIWTKFRHCLENYRYQRRYIKKNSHVVSFSDMEISDDGFEYNGKAVDIGYVTGNDFLFELDFEHIISKLNDIQSFICKCRYHNGWSDKEIRNYLNESGVSDKQYKSERDKIKMIFELYFKGKI